MEPKYKRVIMKISGEALCSPNNKPLDFDIIDNVTEQIIDIAAQGVEIGIIVGGGNIWRGARVGKIVRRQITLGCLQRSSMRLPFRILWRKRGYRRVCRQR